MSDILKLIANKRYWKPFDKKEGLVCAYCQKKIDIPSIPDHFFFNFFSIVYIDRSKFYESKENVQIEHGIEINKKMIRGHDYRTLE